MRQRLIIFIMICVMTAQFGLAQIPRTMTYQGIITNTSGVVVTDGAYDLTFGLYEVAAGGAAIWTESHPDTQITKGIFNVILGEGIPATPLNLPFDKQYWLEIAVNGTTLSPRVKLASSPYSLNANSITENAVTGKKIANGQVVRNINGKTDNINLNAGANVTISENGNTFTISSNDTTGNDWKLRGNTGTTGDFLGTTNDAPLELRVNNSRAFRLEPHATSPNVIGGFSGNNVTSGRYGATISGGGHSGNLNSISNNYGAIGGGRSNTVSGIYATISGGSYNTAGQNFATVSGGGSNEASGYYATVSGGGYNIASGDLATVAGGSYNIAMGTYSLAAGFHAKAAHPGSFVFSDTTAVEPFSSSMANEFSVLCTGGVRFYTQSDPSKGVRVFSGGTSWSSMSDRNIKDNFIKADTRDILERLTSIPMETWSYKSQDPSIRHIGPMAQDFYEAFSYGEDNKYINTLDADGVALAAIQGLYEIVKEKDEKIAKQEEHIDQLQKEIDELKERMVALEKLISSNMQRDW